MRAVLLLALVGCQGDWVPPVTDGTYQVKTEVLPTTEGESQTDAVVFDDKGENVNQLGDAIRFLSSELAVPMPTVTMDVQLAIEDEAVTIVNAGQAGARLPFEAHDNDAFATGGAVTLGMEFAGYDPVQLSVTQASVLLDGTSVEGALGGLISVDEVQRKLVPIAADIMNKVIARDCTLVAAPMSVCGCRLGTDGAALEGILGSGCTVTADSFHTSALLASLIVPYPDGFLSIGMAITTERQ